MSSIGETLRRERLRQNLGLEQISRELKISQRFLEAIEEERFERLPAGVFAKSFVRQYAGILGLDPDEIAAEMQRALEPPPPPPDAARPDVAPIDDLHLPRVEDWQTVGDRRRFEWTSSLPALALLFVVLLVCSGIYTFWQRTRQMTTAQVAPPPPAAITAPAHTQAPATPDSATAQPPPAQEAPKPQAAAPPAAEPSSPANSADRPAPAPVRVQLTAEDTVWVLARADGKYLFSGTMEPNDTRTVEANEQLTLRLGNAGGVAITLNGKPIGAVGPKGQVREIQFTSGGFQIVAGPKPSLPDDNPI